MIHSLIRCPSCQAELRVTPDLQPGTEVRCPSCSSLFPLPNLTPTTTNSPPPHSEDEGIATAPSSSPRSRRITPDADPTAPVGWGERQHGYPEEDEDHPRRFYRDYDADYGEGRTGPLSNQYEVEIGRWLEIATAHFSDRNFWLLAALYTLLQAVITQAIAQIPYVGGIINLFVSPAFAAGLTAVALKQLKGRSWTFGDFFMGFKGEYYLSLVGYNFVMGLVVVLPLLPGGAILGVGALTNDNNVILVGVFALLLLLPVSIYLAVRLGIFGVPLILDRRYRAMEAMQGCWELSANHFWNLFALQLMLGLIIFAGILALCIGYLVAVPYTTLVLSAGYLLVAGTQPPRTRPSEPDEYRY